MKRFLSTLLILAALVSLTPAITGCGSLGSSAHKTETVTLPAVNTEMARWKSFVDAGKATQSQVDAVKAQYGDYYLAQLSAKSAETTWVNSKSAADQTTFVNATTTASTKGAAVIALIETYMNTK